MWGIIFIPKDGIGDGEVMERWMSIDAVSEIRENSWIKLEQI